LGKPSLRTPLMMMPLDASWTPLHMGTRRSSRLCVRAVTQFGLERAMCTLYDLVQCLGEYAFAETQDVPFSVTYG